jgi:hypothetical protein
LSRFRPSLCINHQYVLVVKGCRELEHGIYKTVNEANAMGQLLVVLGIATNEEIEIEKIWVTTRVR